MLNSFIFSKSEQVFNVRKYDLHSLIKKRLKFHLLLDNMLKTRINFYNLFKKNNKISLVTFKIN